MLTGRLRQNSLTINGQVQIAATSTANAIPDTSVVNSLTIGGIRGTWTGQLDLGNNSLVIPGGGTAVRNTVASQIYEGMLGDGKGITSSVALANPAADTTLGYALASDLSATPFTFAGQTVSGTDVLVKYTWKADANLDGVVNVADLGILATNYGQTSGVSWAQGDFNGDGAVNVADLGLLATYYGRGVGTTTPLMSLPDAMALYPQFGGAGRVPEPGTLAVVGVGVAGLLVRRRWNRKQKMEN
jgi:hypothetical protein